MEAPKTTLDPERYKKEKIDKALIRLQLAVKEKDRKKKASAYQDLAWLYYDVKDYEQSIAYGEKLLDISAQMGNEELKVKANANNVLAWAHKDVGDYEKSQGFCRELLRIGDRLRDEQLKASAYQVQAWLFFADEDYAQSSEQGEKFLNAGQNLKDKTLEAKALDVLAWSYLKQGKYEQSQNYGEEFLRISEDLSDQALKAYALEVLAFVFYELENYKQSQKYGQELLRISKELGKKNGEARACEVVAESYIQEGNDQEGRKYAEELLRISKELGKEQEAKAYQVLAKSYSKERKDQERRKYNKQLLRISKELGNKEQEAKACKALANSYIQGGDFRKSIGYGVELLRISKERGNKELEAHACDLLAKSHAEVGDSELSMEYGKELLSISEELGDKKLKSKACCFLGWSDSELEKYEQSKEISKESPRVAKKEEDKTLQAEASGCSELPERQIFNLLRQIEQQAKEDTNNHETGLSENFKRNIKEKGFSISDNQGEGNSMFLALSEQLHLKKRIEISQAELRQTVVQYLKKKPTLLDGTELFHFVDGCSSWDVYLTRMMADGTWGDHVILYGAAHLFQTCIHVISSHHDKVMICPEYDANTRLVLGHVHELHYVSLIPHKDTHVPQAGKKPSFEQTGTPLYADKDDNAKVGELIVESEGTSCALKLGAVHLIFPPNAVSEGTPTVEIYRWKSSVCSPPLQEDEAIVSNVIELSSHDGQQVHFNAMVTLTLSHSAPDLRGYEVVIQRQINKKTNEWEDVRGTKNLSCRQDIEAGLPCHQDIPDLFFPAAQAVISDCSTFAVVCRLKSSPNYTITSTGGLFSHPDYPGVTITIPKNAVASESRLNLELEVQEVPNEDFDEEGVFFGPILRMKCSEVVQFFRPVTIQLPVSLRDRQDVKVDPSKCHVRALFLNCEEEKKKWTELTDLVEPTQFDGKFVRIQVKRFYGYSFCVERREENSGSYGLRNLPHLTRSTGTRYRRASFVAYFGPHIPEILTLICCPNHLRQGVIEKLKKQGVERCADGSSMKDMIPGEDKAFVFLSGRQRPFNEKDVNNIYLRLFEEDSFKTELRIRLVDSEDLVQVEFRNTLKQTDGTHLLCKLHLTPPSSNMPRAENQNSWELAPQPEIKGGSPTLYELQCLSQKISRKWKKLGRRLQFDEAQITEHDYRCDEFSEKAYNLLMAWQQRDASAATYLVLHRALSDVERTDLAEEFCFQ